MIKLKMKMVTCCVQNSKTVARRIARLDKKMPATTLAWPLGGFGGGAVVSLSVFGFTTTEGNGGSATSDSVRTGLGASAGG